MNTETWTLFWWMLYSCVAVSGFCFLGGWIFGRKAKSKEGGYQPTHGNLDSSDPPRGGTGLKPHIPEIIPPAPKPSPGVLSITELPEGSTIIVRRGVF
jgi:hypothetical protein